MAKSLVTRDLARHVLCASHVCADDEFSILVKIQARGSQGPIANGPAPIQCLVPTA